MVIPVETAVGDFQARATNQPTSNPNEKRCSRRHNACCIFIGVVVSRSDEHEQDNERNVGEEGKNSVLHVSLLGV